MARDLNVNRKTVDSDQYVYREERDLSKTRVDWGEISKDLTKTITDIRDDRQTRKDELDKAQTESMNQLAEFDQYNNKSLNESVLEGSEWSKNALSEQYDLMRRGLITPSEYKRYEQRTKDSFGALKGNLDNFSKHYEEAALRVQNGESNIGEAAVNNSLSGLANLGQYELSGNPATGELCYIKTGNDPATGKPYDSKNPANQISLGVINARINQKMNYVATSEAALGEVDKLGEVVDAKVLKQQGVKTMEDWRLLEGSEEMMDRMVGVITNSDAQKLNILQEAGYTSDDFTQDPDVAADDPSKILMTPNPDKSGGFIFQFNEEQEAEIEKNARLALEAQISQKAGFTKGFAEQKETTLEASQTRELEVAHGYMNSLRDFIILGKAGASSGAQNLVNEVNKNLGEGESRIETIDREVDADGKVTSFIIRRADKTSKPIDVAGMNTTQAMRALYGEATPKGAPWDTALKEYDVDMSNDVFGEGAAGGTGSLEDYPTIDAAASRSLGGSEQTPLNYIQGELGGDINAMNDPQVQIKEVYENVIQAILPSEMYDDVMSTDTGQGDGGIRLEFPTETTVIDGVSYEPGDMVIRIGKTTGKIPDYKGGDEWTDDKTIFQYDIIKDIANKERARLEEARFGNRGGGSSSGGGGTPAPSDIRIKNNINLVGTSPNGHNIYTFMYKDPSKHLEGVYQGVMAQEVPHATVQVGEELWVDYNKLDVDFIKVS